MLEVTERGEVWYPATLGEWRSLVQVQSFRLMSFTTNQYLDDTLHHLNLRCGSFHIRIGHTDWSILHDDGQYSFPRGIMRVWPDRVLIGYAGRDVNITIADPDFLEKFADAFGIHTKKGAKTGTSKTTSTSGIAPV